MTTGGLPDGHSLRTWGRKIAAAQTEEVYKRYRGPFGLRLPLRWKGLYRQGVLMGLLLAFNMIRKYLGDQIAIEFFEKASRNE